MNRLDDKYFDLIRLILDKGNLKQDRTGTGTKSIFGHQLVHNMEDGFPMLTTKKVAWKQVITELLWFLNGDTNIKYLIENNCNIWTGDAYKKYLNDTIKLQDNQSYITLEKSEFERKILSDENFAKQWGELGPIYGKQWRDWGGKSEWIEEGGYHYGGSFGGPVHKVEGQLKEVYINGVDQILNAINDLKNNPDSRRIIVNAWNVSQINSMTLPPCHYMFQLYTRELTILERIKEFNKTSNITVNWSELDEEEKYKILDGIAKRSVSLMFNMRSTDVGLGLPFNIASYGLLLSIIAKEVNMVPEQLIYNGGDVHIYSNHIDGLKEQLNNKPFDLPQLTIENWKGINSISVEDFKLENYKYSKPIKLPLSN